jgi:hypothetical protein
MEVEAKLDVRFAPAMPSAQRLSQLPNPAAMRSHLWTPSRTVHDPYDLRRVMRRSCDGGRGTLKARRVVCKVREKHRPS